MPAPGVYILAFVGVAAVGYAFHEFVYEPHIAPKIELWAEEFIARRKAGRLRKQGPVSAPQHPESRTRRNKPNDSSDEGSDNDDGWDKKRGGRRSSFELENLVAKELQEWRSETGSNVLRQRKPAASTSFNTLDESNISIPYSTITPTHVLFGDSEPSTPTSSIGRNVGQSFTTALPRKPSQSTLRTASPSTGPTFLAESHTSASSDTPSFSAGPWVAQQIDLAKRFENQGTITQDLNADAHSVGSWSRSSTPFSHASYYSNVPAREPSNITHQPSPIVGAASPPPVLSYGREPSSGTSSPNDSPMQSISTFTSPVQPQLNISSPNSPIAPLAFSPTIPSLSFTARAPSSDEGDLVSRPSSSMSFLSDLQTASSGPSELSFTHASDHLSSFGSFDDDDLLSVGSGDGPAHGPERPRT
ncbi:hypothetical protein PC9H_004483 [Pleurotus ostreatus]|uniref:Transmembrane protein n=1 Tax=Pleurotus ostreatus TaxID=5322 RepID=A0A8H7A1Z8_PLEOS|nr:uncharacterized protein PC9H_004483 [Pleurotus ostreatus]KAF7432542.1 hypothetical protein PC9H_004483 [Pleurotus ostreatus]KAJ8698977.1 hypothetical protein PTI98_005622 [Pleurotus ostreatus]